MEVRNTAAADTSAQSSRKIVIFRGHSEGYRLAFFGWIRLRIEAENEALERVKIYASEERSRIYELDFDSPAEAKDAINKRLNQMQDRNDRRDTQQFKNKFRQNFDRSSFVDAAAEALRADEKERFRSIFTGRLEENIFPGSDSQVEVKIYNFENNSSPEGKDPVYEKIQEDIEHKLEVKPYIQPAGGRRLRNVELNKQILVRVVGDSVSRLNPSLVAEDAPEDSPYSRPLPVRLAALKVGPSPGTVQFWVNFKEKIYGEGVESENIRVGLYSEEQAEKNGYEELLMVAGSSLLFLFALLFFLFIGFPQYFFYLIF